MLRRSFAAGLSLALPLAFFAACGDADGSTSGGGGSGGHPISDATELVCPSPGLLPFVTETYAWADEDNRLTAEGSDRNKDEASDAVGNPSGAYATTYATASDPSATGDIVYRGKKARTGNAAGLSSVPLRGEAVSLWYYDDAAAKWETLGRTTTDEEGNYSLAPAGAVIANGRPVYSILEADGSCAEHYDLMLPAGTQVVVSDIDGTLTLSDDEFLQQVNDGTYVPKQMGSASELANAWTSKGYAFVYMSARSHLFRSESRVWLRDEGFPVGPMVTSLSPVNGDAAVAYKSGWLQRLQTDYGWDVVAVYGNAQSDIDAYAAAGIAKDVTFIVGPLAGADMTQPIDNEDYADHIATYVDLQPAAN